LPIYIRMGANDMGRKRSEIYTNLEQASGVEQPFDFELGFGARLPNRRIQCWRDRDGNVLLVFKRLLDDKRIAESAVRLTRDAAIQVERLLHETRH
jgi:hypothetical protein